MISMGESLIPKVKKKLIVNIYFNPEKKISCIHRGKWSDQGPFESRSASESSSLLFNGASVQFTLSRL